MRTSKVFQKADGRDDGAQQKAGKHEAGRHAARHAKGFGVHKGHVGEAEEADGEQKVRGQNGGKGAFVPGPGAAQKVFVEGRAGSETRGEALIKLEEKRIGRRAGRDAEEEQHVEQGGDKDDAGRHKGHRSPRGQNAL